MADQNPFDQFDAPAEGNPFDQFDNKPKKSTASRVASDLGKSLKKGIEELPGQVAGLADVVPALALGARPFTKAANAIGEATGFEPGKWAKDTQLSPEAQQSQQEIDKVWEDPTKGPLDVAGAYLTHPAYTANQVVESLPAMGVGGVGSRAVRGAVARVVGEEAAPAIAGGIGEGAQQTGSQMVDGENNPDQQRNAIAALGSGVGDAVIGAGAGRVANALGLETAETLMAGGKRAAPALGVGKKALGTAGRIAAGAANEGILQELPQSMQEQAFQNYAEGKPLGEGVIRAGVEGGLAGAVLGGGSNVMGHGEQPAPPPAPGPLARAAAGAVPLLPNNQTLTADDEGNVATGADRARSRFAQGNNVETGAFGQGRNDEAAGQPGTALAVPGAPGSAVAAAAPGAGPLARAIPTIEPGIGLPAPQARIPGVPDWQQEGDILDNGQPFRGAIAAQRAARKAGIGFQPVQVPGGYVVRRPIDEATDVTAKGDQRKLPPPDDQTPPSPPSGPAGNGPTTSPKPGAPQSLEDTDIEAHGAATSPHNALPAPTKGQALAGNYAVGHTRIGGANFSVENPSGSTREDKHNTPPRWSTTMDGAHYGYQKGTLGADSTDKKRQGRDVFIKEGTPRNWNGPAFVIDQTDPATGNFDEHKTVIGASTEEEARAIYMRHYEPGWKGLGAVTRMDWPTYLRWSSDHSNRNTPAHQLPQSIALPGAQSHVENEAPAADGAQAEPAQGEAAPAGRSEPAAADDVSGAGSSDVEADGVAPQAARFGRNGTPIHDGGKPFKSKLEAARFRRQHMPQTRLVKHGDGFALRDYTDAELNAQRQAGKRLQSDLRRKARERNPFLAFLGEFGLYHEEGKPRSQMREFSPDHNIEVKGYGNIFRPSGMMTDELTLRAAERGFLPPESRDTDKLESLIRQAIRGVRIIPQYAEGAVEADFEEQRQRAEGDAPDPFLLTPEDFADTEYDEADPEVQARVRQLVNLADQAGMDVEAPLEDAAKKTENGTQNDYLEAARDALEATLPRAGNEGEGDRSQSDRQESAAPGQREEAAGVPGEVSPAAPAESSPAAEQAAADLGLAVGDKVKVPGIAAPGTIRNFFTVTEKRRKRHRAEIAFGPEAGDKDHPDGFVTFRDLSEILPAASRETITPADDEQIGQNDAGEPLYRRKDGSVYRMHAGKPDFGGDLAPAESIAPGMPEGAHPTDEKQPLPLPQEDFSPQAAPEGEQQPAGPTFSDAPDFDSSWPRPLVDQREAGGRTSMFSGIDDEAELLHEVIGVHNETGIGLQSDERELDALMAAVRTGKDPETGKPIKADRVEQLRGQLAPKLESIEATLIDYEQEFGEGAREGFQAAALPDLEQLRADVAELTKPADPEKQKAEADMQAAMGDLGALMGRQPKQAERTPIPDDDRRHVGDWQGMLQAIEATRHARDNAMASLPEDVVEKAAIYLNGVIDELGEEGFHLDESSEDTLPQDLKATYRMGARLVKSLHALAVHLAARANGKPLQGDYAKAQADVMDILRLKPEQLHVAGADGSPAITADNVVNGRPRAEDVTGDESLLLMPCSNDKKFGADGTGQAGDVYQGVMWQTLRAHMPSEAHAPTVTILSAKHGLMPAHKLLKPYDEKLTPERAKELIGTIVDQLRKAGIVGTFRDVQIVGGAEYRSVMRAAVAEMQRRGQITADASVREVAGGIGQQRNQLGVYLDAFKPAEAPEPAQAPAAAPAPVGARRPSRDPSMRPPEAFPADMRTYTPAEAGKEWDKASKGGRNSYINRMSDYRPTDAEKALIEKAWADIPVNMRRDLIDAMNEDFIAPAWYVNKEGQRITRGAAPPAAPVKTPEQLADEKAGEAWAAMGMSARHSLLVGNGIGKDADQGKFSKWSDLAPDLRAKLATAINGEEPAQAEPQGRTETEIRQAIDTLKNKARMAARKRFDEEHGGSGSLSALKAAAKKAGMQRQQQLHDEELAKRQGQLDKLERGLAQVRGNVDTSGEANQTTGWGYGLDATRAVSGETFAIESARTPTGKGYKKRHPPPAVRMMVRQLAEGEGGFNVWGISDLGPWDTLGGGWSDFSKERFATREEALAAGIGHVDTMLSKQPSFKVSDEDQANRAKAQEWLAKLRKKLNKAGLFPEDKPAAKPEPSYSDRMDALDASIRRDGAAIAAAHGLEGRPALFGGRPSDEHFERKLDDGSQIDLHVGRFRDSEEPRFSVKRSGAGQYQSETFPTADAAGRFIASLIEGKASAAPSQADSEAKLLKQFPIGTKVRITKYDRLGGKNLTGRTGTVVQGHFDGWYVLLDRTPRERTDKTQLILSNDRLEKIGDAPAAGTTESRWNDADQAQRAAMLTAIGRGELAASHTGTPFEKLSANLQALLRGRNFEAPPAAKPAPVTPQVPVRDQAGDVPAGLKPFGEPFYRGSDLVQGYAKFGMGERVRTADGHTGTVEGPFGAGPVFTKLLVKFPLGEQFVDVSKLEAAPAEAAAPAAPQDLLGDVPNASQQAAATLRAQREERQRRQQQSAPGAEGFSLGQQDQKREGEEIDPRQQELGAAPQSGLSTPEELKAKADLLNALGDLGDVLGKGTRLNITPEQEAKLLPVLTRVFDAAFRLGYIKFKQAAKYVLEQVRAALGADVADAISIDHLQGAYIAMAGKYRDKGADTARAVVAVENKDEVEAADTGSHNGENHVPNSDANSQGPGRQPAGQPEVGADVAGQGSGAAAGPDGTPGERAGSQGSGQQDDQGVSAGGPIATGQRGDQQFPGGKQPAEPAVIPPGADDDLRSGDDSLSGAAPDSTPAATVRAAAAGGRGEPDKRDAQRVANELPVKPGDLENIRAALPYLLPAQQEDVHKAETRFALADGYGMLFTNGTGTGKTFSGLGVVKRFERQGRKNILIVVPDQKILDDWRESGVPLGLEINQLADTKTAGEGVVITTYANLGQNDELAKRDWHLVVADEAHSLMQDKDGTLTSYLQNLRAITLHPDGIYTRFDMHNREDVNRLTYLNGSIEANNRVISNADTTEYEVASRKAENDRLEAERRPLQKKLEKLRAEMQEDVKARQGLKRTRAVFLSATPFAYEPTLDWGNGYLFDYAEGYPDPAPQGYNAPSPRQHFFMSHLGYRMKYGKLNKPGADVDSGLMQRQLNSWMKKRGSVSGRMLDVPVDYDRRFVLIDSAIGNTIDQALEWLHDRAHDENEAYQAWVKNAGESDEPVSPFNALRSAIEDQFDYLSRRYLLEAIKAREAVSIVKQHLALGRKVVVFHDYKKGGSANPFRVEPADVSRVEDADKPKAQAYNDAIKHFQKEFPALFKELEGLRSPIAEFTANIPGTLLINGDEKPAELLKRYKMIQDDSIGPLVALVQSAKNKGWSGHDTTGKYQRVLINLGQPTQPTMAIQQEGRIYRTGNASNAIFRYLNTGTNWEKWAFATTIAERASAAENLGMGELARALKDSFIAGFEESGDFPPGHEGEGTGGKERDRLTNAIISEYDRAKTFYWATQKKTAKTKAQEGKDYFATPEPIGLKMAQWASVHTGEDVLEPSAGHGAIARWFPELAKRTAIEPATALRARLAMVFDGKIIDGTFENHAVVNKYDGIVMNPPFGVGGSDAIPHLIKAASHLRDGGRIVALLPTGPAADKRLEKFLHGSEERKAKPLGTTSRAGDYYRGDRVKTDLDGRTYTILGTDPARGLMLLPDGGGEPIPLRSHYLASVTPGPRTEQVSPSAGLYLIADIQLPSVTFERAGTGVRTHIIVLQKGEGTPQQINRDYSNVEDIRELFDRLEDLELKPRPQRVQQAAPNPIQGAASPDAAPQAKPEGAAVLPPVAEGDLVEHVTGKGKTIRGVIRKDMTLAQAKAIDPYTFKKDGGFFIREKYLQGGNVAQEERAVYTVSQPQSNYDVDLFPDTLDGLQADAGASARRSKRQPAAAGRDVATPATVPGPADANALAVRQDAHFPGLYHVSSQLVTVGQRELSVKTVNSWEDAAAALSGMSRYAVEHFDVLITDDEGKPLAVVGAFKGGPSQTNVYPSTVLMEALRIEGAAHAWGVHNHPSGKPTLSAADERLSLTMGTVFYPSSVEWHGVAAVAHQIDGSIKFTAVDADENPYSGQFTSGPAVYSVPVVERTILRNSRADEITSPTIAMDVAKALSRDGTAGVLFLDAQSSVSAWVPMTAEDAGTLAGRSRKNRKFDLLVNSASMAGAQAAIIVNPAEKLGSMSGNVQNLANALRLADLRVLDVVDPTTRYSAAERGQDLGATPGTATIREHDDLLAQYTQDEALAKQEREERARKEEERQRKEREKPPEPPPAARKLTAQQNDLFNDQGSLFARRTRSASGMTYNEVAAAVQRLTRDWLRRPEVHIVETMGELPDAILRHAERQEDQGAGGSIKGVHFRGEVYLVADAIDGERELAEVLFHETLGHFGLRGVFGELLTPIKRQLVTMRRADVERKAKQYGLDMSKEADRMAAAEEVLAEMAQTRPEIGFVQRAVAAIRTWLREHVPALAGLQLTDDEIVRNYLLPARGWVERGAKAKAAPARAARPAFARDTQKWPRLAALWSDYNDSFKLTGQDLLAEVENLLAEGDAPEQLRAAANRFRSEIEEDRDVWGGRGDLDGEEEAFAAAVDAALHGDAMFSRMGPTRREFIISAAAALAAGNAQADVALGKAKPIPAAILSQQVDTKVANILRGNGAGTTNLEGAKALREAMNLIAQTGPAPVRALAAKIAQLLPADNIMLTVYDQGRWNVHGAVELSPVAHLKLMATAENHGLSYSTVLHETLHAAVAARYRSLSVGVLRSNDAKIGVAAPAASEALAQFRAVWDEFREAARDARSSADRKSDLYLSLSEASGDPDEFFVRALTDPTLQAWMATKAYSGRTLLQRFKAWVKESLFGFKREGVEASWLDAALTAATDLTSAMGGDRADFARLRAINKVQDESQGQRQRSAASAGDDVMFSRGTVFNDLTAAQEAALKRVGGITEPQTLRQRMKALRANMGTKLRQGLVDQFAPIKQLSQEAYMLARLSKGGDGTMEAAMLYGRPFLRDGVPDVDVNDGGFAKVLATLKGEHDRFLWWVAAQRAARLKAEGRENLFDQNGNRDISDLRTLDQGNFADGTARAAVYQAALDDLNAFNESVLKVALESGLITQEAFDTMKGQPYVPFYRIMEEGNTPTFTSRGGLVNQSAYKKLTGGQEKLNDDLLQNMLLNWSHIYTASARNRAAVKAMHQAVNLAVAYPIPVSQKGSVTVKEGGLDTHYMVEDPYLLDAITAISYVPSQLLKPLSAMKHYLTLGVTANPAFKIRNLIRDSIAAIAQSDLSANPLKNIAQGWKGTAEGSQVFASMLAAGGVMRFGTVEDTSRVRRQIEQLGGDLMDAKGWQKLTRQMGTLWEAYQELGDRGENVNRVALYKQLLAKGVTHAEASYMARDLMDFSMSGQWGAVRFLTQTVPFFNARLQGLYKLGRAAADDPRKFAIVTMTVALASLALLAGYHDDDDWKKREDWDRDAYWWFKIGDKAFRIPKPFEIGAIGTLAERTAELMLDKEMTASRYGQRLSSMLFQTFSFDPTPQLLKPMLDVFANKDSFTDKPIEAMGDEQLRPQDRVSEHTSEVGRLLGQLGLPNPAELAKGRWEGLSPKQIDFLLRGYFGWLGTAALTLSDYTIRPLTDRGARAAMPLRDAFLVGNFVESLPSGSSRYVTQMYDQAKAIEQAHGSYRAALKRGDVAGAQEIMAEEGDKIRQHPRIELLKREAAQVNAQIRRVEGSGLLSADQKREQLDALNARRDRLARFTPQ